MDEKEYVNRIFNQYIQTQELLELKEEISQNLHENIMDYLKQGLTKQAAFSKAVEDLGELEQILGGFSRKSADVFKWIYYIASVSAGIGLIIACVTFFEQIGWNGGFLALGCLYPFSIVQSAYILWYKVGKAKKTVWNNVAGIATAVFLFFLVNVVETIFREKYYCDSFKQGIENSAAEIAIAIVALGIAIFAYRRNKSR